LNFPTFASLHGLIIGDVYASDKIKRCPTEMHPRSDNGAYFFDGRRGWVFAWDGEGKTIWWNDETATPWTEAEKREWAAKKRAEEQEREKGYRRAALNAEHIIKRCKPLTHNYLRSKQLPDVLGLVNEEGELFVPMRNLETNALQGGQVIKWLMEEREWQKKMLPGMRAKGAVLRLGSRHSGETWLCEGYATGLSIEAALRRLSLNASVLICFSDRNMVHVAPMVKGRKFVFADHDKSGAGQRAANDTALPFCMSPVEGEDANDLHARAGILTVCGLMMETRRM
jgi:phage/plasmid primase-like uncharacterized protein